MAAGLQRLVIKRWQLSNEKRSPWLRFFWGE